ncbi:unnamed protein product [Bursaphelenchus xylophilus]|uniref:(pine wood nematode) hypothetical protein n=1 Tax=Bursaphelenchus xylophilus TaxID=6326 RepID=A0A7I8WZ62_BURXY|nr:unnamed protein product [Bursaphelenchus xylophilus]CAG9102384.1 unnamed protein product [Bursaphelenchus xylophilus]
MDFLEELRAIANENELANSRTSGPDDGVPLHKKLERAFPRNPSVIGDESEYPKERSRDLMLRPIYINGVEVGYSYGEAAGKKGVLSVRGCVITLWYFILRGHDVKVFFPNCFRRYADKTDDFQLLNDLIRIGLVQFTQGQGQEKYNELSRVLAANARRFGGCIVACSSLRRVFEENQIYQRIVQKRVLVPCFVGNEVLFPADGPEGRAGVRFSRTIVAMPEDEDYEAAKGMQMKIEYQVRALGQLRHLHPNGRNLLAVIERLNEYMKSNRPARTACRPNSFNSEPNFGGLSGYPDGFERPQLCESTEFLPSPGRFQAPSPSMNPFPKPRIRRPHSTLDEFPSGYGNSRRASPIAFAPFPANNRFVNSSLNSSTNPSLSRQTRRPTNPSTQPSIAPFSSRRQFSDSRYNREAEPRSCRKELERVPANRSRAQSYQVGDEEYVVYSYVGGKREERPKFY